MNENGMFDETQNNGEQMMGAQASQTGNTSQYNTGGNQGNGYSQTQYDFWKKQVESQQQTDYSNANASNQAYQSSGYGNQANPYMQMNNENTPPRYPKQKKEHKHLKKFGKAALVGIVAGAGFCGVVFGANKLGLVDTGLAGGTGNQRTEIATTVVSSDQTITAPNDLTAVVNKCMPSIVSINSTVTSTVDSIFGSYDQDSTGSGSGIILKMSDDEILIVTNNHVIDDAKKIVVGFNGMKSEDDMIDATVKGTDSARDLAVVLVKTEDVPEDVRKNISAAEMGSSDDIQVGEMAIAIGNALGYGQSMTVGYISAKDRSVQVDEGTSMKLLQTDAAINPGNSGGALLNEKGELIGINSAKYADTTVEGMGFAIPISDAISVINELMDREVLSEEEKGYLGISGISVTEEVQQQYANMPLGVYVSQVSDDGAAKAAGIVAGDIIVGVDDDEVTTIEALQEKVNSYRVGSKITMKIKRYEAGKYKTKEVEVTLKGKDTLNSITQDTQENNQSNSQQNNNGNNNQDQYGQYYNYFYGY